MLFASRTKMCRLIARLPADVFAGHIVCAYNRTTAKVDKFLANEAKGTNIVGAHSIEELCAKLKKPRRVMLLVKAGPVVDAFIDQLLPYMEKGDIIIDGGNSQYDDSIRRAADLTEKGILFLFSFAINRRFIVDSSMMGR